MDDRRFYEDLAARHRVRLEAVLCLVEALRRGHGRMAQFDHPDLGGAGQWMPGMTMVGNMFDHGARARVEALCAELAARPLDPDLGEAPTLSGSANQVRYAWYRRARRLVMQDGARRVVYDTGDHDLRSLSCQSAGGRTTVLVASQHGPVDLSDLPIVE